MKKLFSILTALCLAAALSCALAEAGPSPEALARPEGPHESGLGFFAIGTAETSGVMFVVDEVGYDEGVLTISVSQRPNDGDTSLMDNQVDEPHDSADFQSELDKASQHGERVMGTLCDIASIKDGEGNELLKECKIERDRDGASLSAKFSVPLSLASDDADVTELDVELALGVNEDLSAHFDATGAMRFHVPVLAGASTRLLCVNPLSDVDELYLVKSAGAASVFLFFSPQEGDASPAEYALVGLRLADGQSIALDADNEDVSVSYASDLRRDEATGRYSLRLLLESESEPVGIRLRGSDGEGSFDVSLTDGAVTAVEDGEV